MVKSDTKTKRVVRTDKKMAADGSRVRRRVISGAKGAVAVAVEIAEGGSAFTPLLLQVRPRPGRVASDVNATYLE